MKQLSIKPEIHSYESCEEFCSDFNIGEGDLIITNEYILTPYFGKLDLKADVVYQEKYGAGEPSDEMVDAIFADVKPGFKRVIAIGGGTVIDIAKVFALKNISPVLDLYDDASKIEKARELVIVPTTCGTGSEVTNLSIFELKSRHTKMGLASDEMYADSAVLIPEILKGLPFRHFATSSIDALIHAMESSLSPKATPYTELFGYRAIEMILRGYMEIAEKGEEARIPLLKDFLIASNYAGIAFGNAGCAAVHAMSYPFGGKYHVAHGEANYCLLTGVFRAYMKKDPDGRITKLNAFIADIIGCGAGDVYIGLEALLNKILQCKPLHEYGVTEEDLPEMADSVMERQTRLLANNYAPFTREDVYAIYREIF